MASLANWEDDENLALVLGLSQPSFVDEQIAQLPPGGSASANNVSRPNTPTSDEKDDLALALRLSQLTSDDFDEQVSQLHRVTSAPASEEALSFTPPNESENEL
jgi:hypothetical protein